MKKKKRKHFVFCLHKTKKARKKKKKFHMKSTKKNLKAIFKKIWTYKTGINHKKEQQKIINCK